MQADYLIIGGGVAGTTAAETIRQQGASGRVVIVSDEPHRFYSRIMLSKPTFFLEKIPFDHVFLKREAWYAEKNITFLGGTTAVSLNPKTKTVVLNNGETISYNKLLLALGAAARTWTIPGADKDGILYLRTLDDAKRVIAAVKKTKRAVVIGAGFIGFEMCDMLRLAGIDTTLVIRETYFWEPLLDEQSGRIIEAALERAGVKIIRTTLVEEVLGPGRVEGVRLNNGQNIPCEMVVVGIGTLSPLEWVTKSGVACNRGILANEYLETNIPDVWTAGDAAEYNDLILGEKIQLGNWVNAQIQGRTAARNMLGKREPFRLVSFYTAQGLGITIAFVGDVRVAPDRTVIQRGSPESGWLSRIIVRNGKVVGATMINRTPELSSYSKIIERGVLVSDRLTNLADSSFDLKSLIIP